MGLLPTSLFRELRPLTADQIAAARDFTGESANYHRIVRGEVLTGIGQEEHRKLARHKPAIEDGAKTHELTRPLRLFAGYSSGASVLGNLWHNDPAKLKGLGFNYDGVLSSSRNPEKAREFMDKSTFANKVFLTIEGRPGLLCLAVSELGLGHGLEEEVILASQPFVITEGRRVEPDQDRRNDIVYLVISNL